MIWTLGASYRVVASEARTFDLLVGTRLAGLNQEIDWEFTGAFGPSTPPPRTGSREPSVDQWDGIVGAKGEFRLGVRTQLAAVLLREIFGAGDSDLTWQAVAGVGYAFGWGDIDVLWRYLDYDLKSSPAIEDMNFNGPALGARFRW